MDELTPASLEERRFPRARAVERRHHHPRRPHKRPGGRFRRLSLRARIRACRLSPRVACCDGA